MLSFNPGQNKYLQTLRAGSKVYVEAGFEVREPEPGADPSTPQGQRQIFLRHGLSRTATPDCSNHLLLPPDTIRLISPPRNRGEGEHSGVEEHS